MSEEKSKSIWKRSLKLPGLFLIWLVLVAAVMFFLDAAIFRPPPFSALLILGIVAATLLVCIWIFIRWLCNWRNFKKSLFGLACFITLIALFYAEEDWRGKHDWNKFKRAEEAKGERFDWQSIVPSPVPDDENFAFSPVWIAEIKDTFYTPERAEAWYGDRIYSEAVAKIEPLIPVSTSGLTGTNWVSVHHLPNVPVESHGWPTAQMIDLKPWQNYYRELEKVYPAAKIPVAPQPQSSAQDVLLALSKFDPVIEQLRKDSAKPYSRFPLQYDGMPAAILLPHLAAEKRIAQVLQLRAIAELQNGESEKALADVKLMLRLTDASRNEPFLISHLVRIAILNLTLQPIYEGLAEHKWSDTQLAELDSELAKLDFLADYEFAIRGERNLEIANIEFLRQPHDLQFKRRFYFLAPIFYVLQGVLQGLSSPEFQPDNFQVFALALGPSGWLDQNERHVAQFNVKWYLPVVDEQTKIVSPAKVNRADDALNEEIHHRTPENVLETLFLPALGAAVKKFTYAQSSTDLSRVAIALERYRLAHGNFPDSLDELSPQFLEKIPHDVIGGKPLHYRRTDDGQFVLYSIGWNETDDGAVVETKVVGVTDRKNRNPIWDITQGDWVWRYPQK